MEKRRGKKLNKTKLLCTLGGIILLLGVFAFLFLGDNYKLIANFFKEGITREEIRINAQKFGIRGVISISLFSMLQVIFMFIPSQLIKIFSGLSYGLWFGTLFCLIGTFVGNTIIYIAYRLFGKRLGSFYSPKIDIDWENAKSKKNLSLIVLILYFLPFIPSGMICFLSCFYDMPYWKYIILTTLGSLVSTFIWVLFGHLLIRGNLIWAIILFAILLIIILLMLIFKKKLIAKINSFLKRRNIPYTSSTKVRKPNKFLFSLVSFGFNLYVSFKFKISFKKEIKNIEKPSIIVVTHGAYNDYMFVLKYLRKYYPHIVMIRYYLYNKPLGTMLKKGGVIPKSIFTADIESAKNCIKVLKNKEVLLMMPEARLSLVGRYEGIQNVTMKFLYQANVPIYQLKTMGNYFSKPKWGKGVRKNSHIECTFRQIFKKEDISCLEYDDFKQKMNEFMDYDNYAWLDSHPDYHYKSKRIAEGLEGILYKCPHCHKEGEIETKGNKWHCKACNYEVELTDRYAFKDGVPFENIAQWFDYQYEEVVKEVASDENYSLKSKVILKHASNSVKGFLKEAGEGICILDRTGLKYIGTEDGKEVNLHFSSSDVYRLLFGPNENIELYVGKQIFYFIPENPNLCVKWYLASIALKDYFKE